MKAAAILYHGEAYSPLPSRLSRGAVVLCYVVLRPAWSPFPNGEAARAFARKVLRKTGQRQSTLSAGTRRNRPHVPGSAQG